MSGVIMKGLHQRMISLRRDEEANTCVIVTLRLRVLLVLLEMIWYVAPFMILSNDAHETFPHTPLQRTLY